MEPLSDQVGYSILKKTCTNSGVIINVVSVVVGVKIQDNSMP